MATHRMESVGREVQREIASIVRNEIDDPLIGFVTITDVEMSPDLKLARVYFSVLGSDEDKENAGRGLRRAAKFIRGLIAERIELRYTPSLRFYLDETPERAQRIEELLRDNPADIPPDEEDADEGDR